jgi:hypothetical protein
LPLHTRNQAIALLTTSHPRFSNSFRAVYEANGWKKKKVCNSKSSKKLYPPPRIWQNGNLLLFLFSSLASPLTNKNCYFIAKPYLYVFCCAALSLRRERKVGWEQQQQSARCGVGKTLRRALADFEQFIYFSLRCCMLFKELRLFSLQHFILLTSAMVRLGALYSSPPRQLMCCAP